MPDIAKVLYAASAWSPGSHIWRDPVISDLLT
jgi:hypothetical protein